jgi:hypothetical protein
MMMILSLLYVATKKMTTSDFKNKNNRHNKKIRHHVGSGVFICGIKIVKTF